MLTPKKERYVCNNCAATKAGEKCDDCAMHGCQCPCQSESAEPSKPTAQESMNAEQFAKTKWWPDIDWNKGILNWSAACEFAEAYASQRVASLEKQLKLAESAAERMRTFAQIPLEKK